MNQDQHKIHHDRGDHRLQNTDDDGTAAKGLQLAQPELIAHSKGDKAQRHLG